MMSNRRFMSACQRQPVSLLWDDAKDLLPFIRRGDILEFKSSGFSLFSPAKLFLCVKAYYQVRGSESLPVVEVVDVSGEDIEQINLESASIKPSMSLNNIVEGNVGRIIYEPIGEEISEPIGKRAIRVFRSAVSKVKRFFKRIGNAISNALMTPRMSRILSIARDLFVFLAEVFAGCIVIIAFIGGFMALLYLIGAGIYLIIGIPMAVPI